MASKKDDIQIEVVGQENEIIQGQADEAAPAPLISENSDEGTVSADEALAQAIEQDESIQDFSTTETKTSSRRALWIVFGIFAALALIVPATFVYLKSLEFDNPPTDLVVVPLPGDENSSTAETKTAEPGTSKESSDTFGAEYEDWNYQELGRNLASPKRGPRVYDAASEVNPEFYDTYRKASGVDSPYLSDLDIQIRVKSGTNPISPDSNQNGSGESKPQVAVIRLLSTNPAKNQASFLVDDTFAEVTVGGQIGRTGWFLKVVDGNTVQITNGNDIITLTVNSGTL